MREDLDSVNRELIQKVIDRAELGVRKYGTTMDREDLSLLNWLQHLQEEMLDACVYIQKILTSSEGVQNAKTNQSDSSGSEESQKVQGGG